MLFDFTFLLPFDLQDEAFDGTNRNFLDRDPYRG